jgi:histidinol phosphatase-like enzyme
MIIEAAARHSLALNNSYMVGDKPSDRIQLEGLRSYIVKSDYCQQDYDLETVEQLRTLL